MPNIGKIYGAPTVTQDLGKYGIAASTGNVFSDSSTFPSVGKVGSTYLDLKTGHYYLWNGKEYQIVNDCVLLNTVGDRPVVGVEGVTYVARDTMLNYVWNAAIGKYETTVFTPIGAIYSYAGTTAPSGEFMIMDGSPFSITTYPELHQLLTASWNGYVSGVIPDMRNMYTRMKNATRVIGDYQADMILQHAHSASLPAISTATVIGSDDGLYSGNGNFGHRTPTSSGGVSVGDVTGASAGSEVRTKNVAVNFIIKICNKRRL